MHDHKVRILSVNETHLDSSIPLSSVHIPGYTLYRKDRNLHGGGVCIYVHTRFNSHAQPITSLGIECLFVRLRICTNPQATDLVICSVYRPPSTSVDFWESYSQQLDTATRHTSNIIVLGDLNTDILQPSRTGHYSHLRSLCEEFNLRNVVTVPTRLGKTCLDLALVYKDAPHTNTTVHCLDGISDHDLVIVKFAYVITPPVQTTRKYVRKPSACTVDPVFGDDLKAQLFDFPASSNASAQADQLATCIATVLNNHAPQRVVRPPAFSKPKPHPWLTDRLKYLLQQRTHLHRKVRAHLAEQQLLQKYRAVRREGTLLNKKLKSEYYVKQFRDRRRDPRGQWALLNSLSGRQQVRVVPAASISDLTETFADIVHDPSRPEVLLLPAPAAAEVFTDFLPVSVETVSCCRCPEVAQPSQGNRIG